MAFKPLLLTAAISLLFQFAVCGAAAARDVMPGHVQPSVWQPMPPNDEDWPQPRRPGLDCIPSVPGQGPCFDWYQRSTPAWLCGGSGGMFRPNALKRFNHFP